MCHLPKLQTLNISGNVQLNLLDVRPVFQNMTELRSLSIADILSMPLGIFVPLSNLLMLNISGTHLNNETIQILNPLAKLKVTHAVNNSHDDDDEICVGVGKCDSYYSFVVCHKITSLLCEEKE
jgi:hypothetical protein